MEHQVSGPRRRQKLVTWPIAAPLAALVLVAVAYVATRPLGGGEPQPSFYVIGSAVPGVQIGQIAPGTAGAPGSSDFGLIDLDGAPVALAGFGGHPIWIIFWKTACAPCEAEAPDVEAAFAAHQTDGLIILGIDLWDTTPEVRDYAATHPVGYPIAIDQAHAVLDAYGVWGAPTHYFMDAAGIIKFRYFGPMTRNLIEESLRKII